MHPDRRRAGRAIRKARRQERERVTDYVFSGQFGRDFSVAVSGLAAAFASVGEAILNVGRALRMPPTRNQVALPPAPGALRRSGPPSPYPTQSGVERAREAYSDSAEERIDRAAAALGYTLLPWQRAAAAVYLRGERLVVYGGRGSGRTLIGRVVEQAELAEEDDSVDQPHHLQGD
jgi:hypothetical protein